MDSLHAALWNYVSVAPMVLATINSVIAVSVSYFPPEDKRLKVALLLFAIVAGLAAAATTIAGQHHALEVAQDERDNAERERTNAEQRLTTLGQLITEGDALQGPIGDPSVTVDTAQINAWINKTEEFLSKELGPAFVSRFRDYAGLNTPHLPPSLMYKSPTDPHAQVWAIMTVRLARLQQFSEELSARLR